MTDKLFTKRLRDLTDEAIRESLAEISVEFQRRFGSPSADAILALTPVEGVGETTREQCAKVAERIAECANTSGRSGCCETTGAEIATAIRDLPLSTPVAQGDEVRAALERVLEALTPHGETKAAYMGEFSWTEWLPDENGVEQGHQRTVPWTTIKEIMAAIRDRASVEKLDEAKALATLTKGARDAG